MLVTSREAAKELYVSIGMIAYWIRKGRLTKHPTTGKHYFRRLSTSSVPGRRKTRLLATLVRLNAMKKGDGFSLKKRQEQRLLTFQKNF
jgi:hypothetical protein